MKYFDPSLVRVTYPGILSNRFVLAIWRKLFCPFGWHLLDAYFTVNDQCEDEHGIVCDACEFGVIIKEEHKEEEK